MEIKDIQIDILAKTIGSLHKEIAELRSALIVYKSENEKAEVSDNGDR